MKICLLGLDNLAVLAPEYRQCTVAGEAVQQTLLARALARAGHDVSMVVADWGQPDCAEWDGVRAYKAYPFDRGLPVVRFIHPRWTELWAALRRADADLYYTSCAGMQVGLLALFCRRFGRRFVFRAASDSDCDKNQLLIRFARDRWLYAYGLRRADARLVQSVSQAIGLLRNYGLTSRVAGMFVEQPPAQAGGKRDVDILWVGNIRGVKRPDRIFDLAERLPDAVIHMVGGALPGEAELFDEVRRRAAVTANIVFHGRLSYADANNLYARARLLVNTSDVEGFPNAFLQAWIRGVPAVTLFDADGLIEREQIGVAVRSVDAMARTVAYLLADETARRELGQRCRAFMDREFAEEKVLAAYLSVFDEILGSRGAARRIESSASVNHA